jgi:hypothetical protein
VRRRVVVLCTAVVVLLGAAALLGCGEPAEDTTTGSLILTVYTSGTLQGDGRQAAQDGADAVKLALEQAGGMVGPFTVNVVSLDDTDPHTGHWGADQVVTNAQRVGRDGPDPAVAQRGRRAADRPDDGLRRADATGRAR